MHMFFSETDNKKTIGAAATIEIPSDWNEKLPK